MLSCYLHLASSELAIYMEKYFGAVLVITGLDKGFPNIYWVWGNNIFNRVTKIIETIPALGKKVLLDSGASKNGYLSILVA